MSVDGGRIIDILYIRGKVTAPGIAGAIGEGVESVDVSAQLMDLLHQGLVEESRTRHPHWRLTEAGIRLGRDRKARSAG
jgi:hypothetical protein